MIKKVSIKNFRGFKEINFEASNFTIFIGDNQTGKTSILEAINFGLSPYFLSGRIKHTDFNDGTDEPIDILLETEQFFNVNLPDGYTKQTVECKGVKVEIKKRERAAPGKAFNELAVIDHYYLPMENKDQDGWVIKRKSGSEFRFDERLLSLGIAEADFLRAFYFSKDRDRQITKGFNSSFSTIIDDFNWRFLKEIQKQESGKKAFHNKKNELETEILNKLPSDKDVIKILNGKLNQIGLSDIKISFIDPQAPFDNTYLARQISSLDLPVKYLGSGIEMIISLLFLETLASFSRERLVILIDEPELHLHPVLQLKLADYLLKLSQSHQIFVSTHSPFFYKECLNKQNVKTLITKKVDDQITCNDFTYEKLFPWSPSWGEITFFAYDLPTIEFHDELYGYLQEMTGKFNQDEFDDYLNIPKEKDWTPERDGSPCKSKKVTLQTFIRNKIHHPENSTMKSINFTAEELKESIKQMIELIKQKNIKSS